MSSRLSGGCACGAVRYECSAEPLFGVNCHCRDCQRETGSAYAAVLAVPKAAFVVTKGAPRFHELTAASGRITRRRFCGECGSPLYGEPGAAGELIMVRAGSLDDPGIFRPTRNVYTASAQAWDFMDPALPKSAQLPEGPP